MVNISAQCVVKVYTINFHLKFFFISLQTIEHPLCIQYPPSMQYKRQFLKELMKQVCTLCATEWCLKWPLWLGGVERKGSMWSALHSLCCASFTVWFAGLLLLQILSLGEIATVHFQVIASPKAWYCDHTIFWDDIYSVIMALSHLRSQLSLYLEAQQDLLHGR